MAAELEQALREPLQPLHVLEISLEGIVVFGRVDFDDFRHLGAVVLWGLTWPRGVGVSEALGLDVFFFLGLGSGGVEMVGKSMKRMRGGFAQYK